MESHTSDYLGDISRKPLPIAERMRSQPLAGDPQENHNGVKNRRRSAFKSDLRLRKSFTSAEVGLEERPSSNSHYTNLLQCFFYVKKKP